MDASSELERRRGELEALHAVALASNQGLAARSVLDAAVSVVHRTFDATATIFMRFDPARRVLLCDIHRGLDPDQLEVAREVPLGAGMNGVAALTRKPQLTPDYTSDGRSLPGLRSHGFRGSMAVPVVVGEELLGTVATASSGRTYDEDDLRVLASIGVQLGTVLDNARLLERLRASEARHRTVVEAAPNVFYEANREGDLAYVSTKIEELTGHPRARFEREPGLLGSLVHPEDRALRLEKLASLAKPGDRAAWEYRLLRANGVDIVWVADEAQARASLPGEPPGLVVTGVLVDLSARKLLEAAAREHARLASLGELAAGVAHEINNPLSGILSYAQLAKRYLQQPAGVRAAPPEQQLREPLDGILAEAERILEITRTLVAFAKRPELEAFRPLPAHELVRASLTIMKQRLKEDSIALEVDVPQDLPPLRARGHELTQVLQNLITNARHALNARFPRWDPAKVLSFKGEPLPSDERSPAGYVRLSVRDRGCGIRAEDRERIFVPFFTTKPQGTGLGLSIAREIVLAHGGRIEFTSSPGEGTTFSFTVPAF